MKIIVNGSEISVPTAMSVAKLVEFLELDVRKVAIEINESVVPRAQYSEEVVREGDRVEIVHFIGGG